ncbi:MAG: outer membrane beta-barrel protein [Bdellovibrionales bacterium]
MMNRILMVICGLLISAPAWAQEYGALVGVHQTDAETSATGASIDGKLNFKGGLAVAFELMENSRFRTGVIYNRRHIEVEAASLTTEYNFSYLDIPALYQHSFNEMFGLFGGLVIGVNVSDDVEAPSGTTAADPDAETMIPLLTVGANLMFDDMIGFDFYYERGMGDIAEDLENYSTFGANFLYWF